MLVKYKIDFKALLSRFKQLYCFVGIVLLKNQESKKLSNDKGFRSIKFDIKNDITKGNKTWFITKRHKDCVENGFNLVACF